MNTNAAAANLDAVQDKVVSARANVFEAVRLWAAHGSFQSVTNDLPLIRLRGRERMMYRVPSFRLDVPFKRWEILNPEKIPFSGGYQFLALSQAFTEQPQNFKCHRLLVRNK